ncbi:MAG: N-acetylneuraminate synthase family protein [Desulfobacterales bacterium]|nr:MAG: N-acetylneuraminate synthase family protein [Desulfobacterales bacterium]
MSQRFNIGGIAIGPEDPCLVVAEVAQAHDGSLGTAHAYIDAIAESGAQAVKFQTHIASAESTPDEPWRVKFSPQDATRYDYWKRMEFTEEQWCGLKRHADERGLVFLSSPFSVKAVELLKRVGVAAWKVPSGETTNAPMLKRMMATGLPVILSTGMSPISEIDTAVGCIKSGGVPLAVLQCTTAYPCPPEKIGLNLISEFLERYGCAVGLSDHSGTIYPGLAAATLGIDILETHVTFSRKIFGPDVPASITIKELRRLVEGIRFIETMMANPVNKEQMAREMESLRNTFTKSVVVRIDLPAGTTLREEHLALKKPGTGIPAARLPELIGRRLKQAVTADSLLSEDKLV